MAIKKKESKKTSAKKTKPIRLQSNVKASAPVVKEQVYPAIDLARVFGISDFAFYMIQEAKGINEGSLITMSDFQKYYQEVVEGR